MTDVKPSFYAIIPANVRYDKQLTPNAKLLYGEITALSNEKGYCWANNNYFAELYEVSKTSISKWVSSLEKRGYITNKLIYKEGSKEILHRYISIVNEPIEEKLNTPIKEKLKDNTTILNTTINTTLAQFEEFWNRYPKKQKKLDAVKAWNKLKPNAELVNLIMIALGKHKRCDGWMKDKGQFIPLPASWLNGERWTDEMSQQEERKELPEY